MACFVIKDLMIKVLPDEPGARGDVQAPCGDCTGCSEDNCTDCDLTWFTTGCTPAPLTVCTPFPCTAGGRTNTPSPRAEGGNLLLLKQDLQRRLAELEQFERGIEDRPPNAKQLDAVEERLLAALERVKTRRKELAGDKKTGE